MWALYRKELNAYFSGLTGYMAILVFLVVLGLLLWVFPDFSLLLYPNVTLQPLFTMAPAVLLFLIPALCMGVISAEHQNGTFELLITRPVSTLTIVTSKYLAVMTVVCLALLPTLLYLYTLHQLGSPPGNIDAGQAAGSYLGLFFLSAVYVSIGIFCSAISNSQIVSFLLSVLLCAFMYWGFHMLSRFPDFMGSWSTKMEALGIDYHYYSISRGLIDTRDVLYFLSMIIFFGGLTLYSLSIRNRH